MFHSASESLLRDGRLTRWDVSNLDSAFRVVDMVFDGCNADIQILADQFCEISQRSSKLAGDNAEKDPALFR